MMNTLSCANLGDIDVSLLLPWWVVDDALEWHCWSIDNFEGNFFDLHCFCCANLWLIDFSLLVLWQFVDDSLEKHWRCSEDFIQTFVIINVFTDLISETLTFHCCLVDESLMTLWGDKFETLTISMEFYWSLLILFCNYLNHWCLIASSLMSGWWLFEETLMALRRFSMQTVKIIEVSNVIIIRKLMFFCCLID